jgi:amidophosphoribosyltransferase
MSAASQLSDCSSHSIFTTKNTEQPFTGCKNCSLLMQKMRNRGQDGAGLATIKLNPRPAPKVHQPQTQQCSNYLADLFDMVWALQRHPAGTTKRPGLAQSQHAPMGEVLMGHLRYGTHGDNSIELVPPLFAPKQLDLPQPHAGRQFQHDQCG